MIVRTAPGKQISRPVLGRSKECRTVEYRYFAPKPASRTRPRGVLARTYGAKREMFECPLA